jgi:hypothetical protein
MAHGNELSQGEAEVIAGGEDVDVHVRGRLRRVFHTDALWFATVEIPSNSGGWQRICVPLRTVRLAA